MTEKQIGPQHNQTIFVGGVLSWLSNFSQFFPFNWSFSILRFFQLSKNGVKHTKKDDTKPPTGVEKKKETPSLFPQHIEIDAAITKSSSSSPHSPKLGHPVACATDSNINFVQLRNHNGAVIGWDISDEHVDGPTYLENNDFGMQFTNQADFGNNLHQKDFMHFGAASGAGGVVPIEQSSHVQPQYSSKLVMRNNSSRQRAASFAPYDISQRPARASNVTISDRSDSTTSSIYDTFSPEIERHSPPELMYTNSPENHQVNHPHSFSSWEYQQVADSMQPQPSSSTTTTSSAQDSHNHYFSGATTSSSSNNQSFQDQMLSFYDDGFSNVNINMPLNNGMYPLPHSGANSENGDSVSGITNTANSIEFPATNSQKDIWIDEYQQATNATPLFADSATTYHHHHQQQQQQYHVGSNATSVASAAAAPILPVQDTVISPVSSVSSHNSYPIYQESPHAIPTPDSFAAQTSPASIPTPASSTISSSKERTLQSEPPIAATSAAANPFVCPHCEASFRIRGYLTRHMKKHASKKAYNCPYYCADSDRPCHPSGGFSRRDTYKTHLKARHFIYPTGTRSAERGTVPGSCGGCGTEYSNNEKWIEEHVQAGLCSGVKNKSFEAVEEEDNDDDEQQAKNSTDDAAAAALNFSSTATTTGFIDDTMTVAAFA